MLLAARERRTHDVMFEYVFNSTSSVNAQSSTTSSTLAMDTVATDPLIGVIVILSVVVVGGIFFVICGLFLKAEAHLHTGRHTMTEEGLLVEPASIYCDV